MSTMYKRCGSWYSDYRVNGKRIRKALGRNKRAAAQVVHQTAIKIERGELGLNTDTELDDFVEKYLEYSRTKKSKGTYALDKGMIGRFLQWLKETQR